MWMFRRGAEVSSRGVDVATTAVLFQELAANFAGRDDEWTALARLRGRHCMTRHEDKINASYCEQRGMGSCTWLTYGWIL
jgi:hypothetical protein